MQPCDCRQLHLHQSLKPSFHSQQFHLSASDPQLAAAAMKLSTRKLPSSTAVLIVVLLKYFLVTFGFIYDVILVEPRESAKEDSVTCAVQPVVFLSGRVNGQYIIEGLSSGFMFVLGGLGLIARDLRTEKTQSRNVRLLFMRTGVGSVYSLVYDEHAVSAYKYAKIHAVTVWAPLSA